MGEYTYNVKRNLSMLTDFYELTMANGYFENGFKDQVAYFDMFFRKVPDNGGFAIMAGLQQLIEYLENLSFSYEDIEFLRSKNIFSYEFLEYLKNFRFSCDVWAVPEGTPIFPKEPIITVKGPVIEAQFIETMVLLCINHQSLIATKANRIVRAAKGKDVIEFGSRRAQGFDAAIYGARAAYIGGCSGTACTASDLYFDVPAGGTMAHSWVQLFDSELDAFRAYARLYPDECVLLVDTYSTLKSGVPNAIKIFNEEILPRGFRPKAIRIDSGDITYLSNEARKMLDENGFEDCKIFVSNSLNENIIKDMIDQDAKVDVFGVGEQLITAASNPVFGGVYKLAAIERDGKVIPKIKISENASKITTPGIKEIWRLFNNDTKKAVADVITLYDEVIDDSEHYEIFDPEHTWKKKTITNFTAKKLRVKIFENGQKCYESPSIDEIKSYCKDQLDMLWPEIKRLQYPYKYYVDLSMDVWRQKRQLIIKNMMS